MLLETSNNGTGSLLSADAVLVLEHNDVKAIHADGGRAVRVGDHHVPGACFGLLVRADNDSLRLVREGYSQGQFDFLRLLTTQRTYFQTNIAYLESVQQWWTAKLEIDGLLLFGGLEKPPIDLFAL